MIQIYSPTNTNFDQNGSVLTPISCELSIEINGVWSVQLESVLNDEIVENAVLKVPTPYGDQLYRIYSVTKTSTMVNAIAVPIFQDAQNEVFIYDTRPTNKNGQQALDDICTIKYKGHSDITKQTTAYYQMKNLINCLVGDDENSFINRWGGEIRYDNYDVYINERLGQDNGVRVEFGLNIKSIQEDIDMSSVATKIIPVAYNGRTLPQGQTVNSPLINNYPTPYIKVIEYQDIRLKEDVSGDQEGVTVCDTLDELYTALTERAEQEFENGIDLPTITYNVDIVDLSRMDEYKNYKPLVTINLGDTVHIYHKRLNINTEARVIALTYDCINQKNSSLTIGDYQQSFFDNASDTSSVVDKVVDKGNGTLLGDKIQGVINLMNTALKAQKNVAERQDVRAILFEDLDEDSSTFGALCIGTQGIQISKERNATNTDWVWGTAIDFQTINANLIVAGILTDQNGKFFFNLNTGEFSASDGTFSGTITGSNINGGSITGTTVTGGTINGTTITGTTISGGTINGTTISGGTITGTTINTDKDINVGNNIYIGDDFVGAESKGVYFDSTHHISSSKSGTISIYCSDGDTEADLRVYNDSIYLSAGANGEGYGTISVSKDVVDLLSNGDIVFQAEGDITANKQIKVISDMRMKANICDVNLADLVDEVKIKEFDIKGTHDVGVIAQDFLNSKFKDYVVNEGEYYSVNYHVLYLALIQKVQELERRLNENNTQRATADD